MLSATSGGVVRAATCLMVPSGRRSVRMEDSSVMRTNAARPYNGPANQQTRTPCLAFAGYNSVSRQGAKEEAQSTQRRASLSELCASYFVPLRETLGLPSRIVSGYHDAYEPRIL